MSYTPSFLLNIVMRISGALETDESRFSSESAVKSGQTLAARVPSVNYLFGKSLDYFVSNYEISFAILCTLNPICIGEARLLMV